MLATHNATVVLFPAFEIQVAIQKATLGVAFWERLAARRRELTARGAFDIKAIVALYNEGRTRETAVVAISERHWVPYAAMYDVTTNAPLFQPPPTPRNPDHVDEDGNEYFDRHGNQVDKNGKIIKKKADLEKESSLSSKNGGGGAGEGLATDRSSGADSTSTDTARGAGADHISLPPPSAPPATTMGANGRIKPTALPPSGGGAGSRRGSVEGDPASLGNNSMIATDKINLGGNTSANGVRMVKGIKQPGDLGHLFAYRMAGGEKGKFNPSVGKKAGGAESTSRRGSTGGGAGGSGTGSGGKTTPIVLPDASVVTGGSRRGSTGSVGGNGTPLPPPPGSTGGPTLGGTGAGGPIREVDRSGGLAQLGGTGGPQSRRNSYGTGLSDFTAMQLKGQAVLNEKGEVVIPSASAAGSRRGSISNSGSGIMTNSAAGSGSGSGSMVGDPATLARLAGYKLSTSPQGSAPGSPEVAVVDSSVALAAAKRAGSASRAGPGGAAISAVGPSININDPGAVMRLGRRAGAMKS
jgi:hypothetical protein